MSCNTWLKSINTHWGTFIPVLSKETKDFSFDSFDSTYYVQCLLGGEQLLDRHDAAIPESTSLSALSLIVENGEWISQCWKRIQFFFTVDN